MFGADQHHDLSEDEQLTIALRGRAVSPVTSYLAAEPGVRPSTIGLEEVGMIGTGRYGTIGHGSGGGGSGVLRVTPDLRRLFDPAACVARLRPAAPWTVALAVETTRDEIVDVTPGADTAMARCVAEAAWAVRLDRAVFTEPRETFRITLSGPAAP